MDNIERDLGKQPVANIMDKHGLKAHDLVASSEEQLTHKMVSRAAKGRWLTPNTRQKVLRALNKAAGKEYRLDELFNY